MKPVPLVILLLIAPLLAGCLQPTSTATPVAPAVAPALEESLRLTSVRLDFPAGPASGGMLLNVTPEDWDTWGSYHELMIKVEVEGVSEDSPFVIALYEVDGAKVSPYALSIGTGSQMTAFWFLSREADARTFLITASTDDPAGVLRVRYGIAEGYFDPLAIDTVTKPLLLEGAGAGISTYWEYTSLFGMRYEHEYGVEKKDSRLRASSMSGPGTLSLTATHATGGPALHTAMAISWPDAGSGRWAFTSTRDGSEEKASGRFVSTVFPLQPAAAFAYGGADEETETTYTVTPEVEGAPVTFFTSVTLPLDLTPLGLTMEEDLLTFRGFVPMQVAHEDGWLRPTAEGLKIEKGPLLVPLN